MKKKIHIIIAGVLLLSIVSCTYNIEGTIDLPNPKAVLNATLIADSMVKANVSRTLNYHGHETLFIDDASVELFVNDISRGIMQRDTSPGGYLMQGCYPATGDKIRMEVQTSGYDAISAEVHMPSQPEILKVDTQMIFLSDGYSLSSDLKVNLTFRENPREKNFYLLSIYAYEEEEKDTVRRKSYNIQVKHDEELLLEEIRDKYNYYYPGGYYWYPPKQFIFSDDQIKGADSYELKLSVQHLSHSSYSDTLNYTCACVIELANISESLYLYKRSKHLQMEQEDDLFGEIGLREPIPTYTNVRNGYGILSAQQSQVYEIKIAPARE